MKKVSIFLSGIIAVVLLSGCFGFLKKEDEKKPAAVEQAKSTKSISPTTKATFPEIARPPSFQDGEFYLKALQTNDASICVKISNEKLRERCNEKAK